MPRPSLTPKIALPPTPFRSGFVSRKSYDMMQEDFRDLVVMQNILKFEFLRIQKENEGLKRILKKMSITLDNTTQT